MKEQSIIEKLLDEHNDDNIILTDDCGNDIELMQIAVIELNDRYYPILQPTVLQEGMTEDDVFVFEIFEDGNELVLKNCEDYNVISDVFNEYYKLLEAKDF